MAVTITSYPALRKFLEYSHRVGEFRAYGIPWPEVAVPLTGIIELVAIVSIGLLVSAGICLLGTSPYSYWPLSRRSVMGGTERTKGASELARRSETE